jgi:hypothetical protein
MESALLQIKETGQDLSQNQQMFSFLQNIRSAAKTGTGPQSAARLKLGRKPENMEAIV